MILRTTTWSHIECVTYSSVPPKNINDFVRFHIVVRLTATARLDCFRTVAECPTTTVRMPIYVFLCISWVINSWQYSISFVFVLCQLLNGQIVRLKI